MTHGMSKIALAGAFVLLAAPVAAQDANLCGGAGANGQWLGETEAGSDIATSADYLEQMALVLARNEYVGLFSVSEAGDYRIEADGGDTVIDVRDASGVIVASDDDSGGNAHSRTETFLDVGNYCVSMRSFDGSPLTGMVRVSRLDQDDLTEGFESFGGGGFGTGECDLDAAQPLLLGQSATNSYSAQSMYALTLSAPTSITLTAENEEADPILILFDQSGNWLAENDDFDGLNSRIDMENPLNPGTYCIMLDLYGDESLPITVSAREYDPQEVLLNLYARGQASPPLDGSYPVTMLGDIPTGLDKRLSVGGDAIWFAFDVTEPGLMLVEAIAQGQGDPVLVMYDGVGNQVGYNDDAEGTLNSLLTVRVRPGTYLTAVSQLDRNTTGSIRIIFERYVPATE
ncbi:MAG: ABC transporter substrate-binding protein [Pseudomonadota bacterium]